MPFICCHNSMWVLLVYSSSNVCASSFSMRSRQLSQWSSRPEARPEADMFDTRRWCCPDSCR